MISPENLKGYLESNWDETIAGDEYYPNRMPYTVLRGTWEAMGTQYGKFQARYIRIVYDALYSLWLKSDLRPTTLRELMKKFEEETSAFSPQMMEFLKGEAAGATDELGAAIHADAMSSFEKVFFVNSMFELAIPSSWEFLAEISGQTLSTEAIDFMRSLQISADSSFASHSWAAWGAATRSGSSVVGGVRDQPWFPLMYSCSYIAIPADPSAKITFVNTISGVIAASAQLNEKGVYVGNTIVGNTWNSEAGIREQAIGVPALIATAHVSFFANSAKDAATILTTGDEKFRSSTGRNMFPYTVGFNQLFADRRGGLVVERTANHYWVRAVGESRERGSYIVLTNHNLSTKSIGADGESQIPMEKFGSGESSDRSSAARYWSLNHALSNNIGRIDVGLGMNEIETMKHIFTKEGKRVDEINDIPVWKLGYTPQRFLFHNPRSEIEFPYGGSLTATVADLESLDVYYTLGLPEYWDGPWQHISLADPSYNMIRSMM